MRDHQVGGLSSLIILLKAHSSCTLSPRLISPHTFGDRTDQPHEDSAENGLNPATSLDTIHVAPSINACYM